MTSSKWNLTSKVWNSFRNYRNKEIRILFIMQLKSYSIDFTKKERHSFTMVRTLTSNVLGDRGNEFFIILKGSVGVKIPKIVE